MHAQIARPWTLAELAHAAHISPRTLQRRFTVETGTTPSRWVLIERLTVARELLETTHLSVEQIAHRAGFGSADLLRKHFSAQMATSPTRYREAFARAVPLTARRAGRAVAPQRQRHPIRVPPPSPPAAR